ncbi:DGQHR domain-containing protein [Aeromonas sp. S13(2024)]|uniref:DGQHR domain-containing protein n=1 Tax=Aeromonas sp. S13(2024) TaxID=3242886 RepID=UPI003528E52D
MKEIKIKALEITQPIGSFYCGVIDAALLKEITYSDIRRLEKEDGRELDSYIGIQRPLSESRMKQINKYISNIDATFPNSIIVSINERDVRWDAKTNIFTISYDDDNKSDIAKILDGQHRISGFTNDNSYFITDDGDKQSFELLVTIFVNSDLSTQANIFATVNLAQTKVNRSLVYDLESLAIARSPEKTCHDIAVLMNRQEGPFFRRIKRLGVATPNVKNELLTQALFVSNMIKLISPDVVSDRNYYLSQVKGGVNKNHYKLSGTTFDDKMKYPFRESFLGDNDTVIAHNIFNFFSAVNELWPNAWKKENKKSVLNKSIGFIALCRVMRLLMRKVFEVEGINGARVINTDEFYEMLDGGILDESIFDGMEPVSKSAGVIYKLIVNNLAV